MRKRGRLASPEGLSNHVSRAEAALLLGYPSPFKVRQLEKQGRLRAVRGAMASAWYPRSAVLALRDEEAARAGATPGSPIPPRALAGRRRSDGELITYLRGFRSSEIAGSRAPTVADLVAEMGVSIARAQKVYRFWLHHDAHPTASAARAGGPRTPGGDAPGPPPAGPPLERRSVGRLERGALIRQLRSPDPALRAAAYESLKKKRPSADGS
ncbi:MAG TPA: hypothetical protein VGP07_02410 [Polyangia bacterium]